MPVFYICDRQACGKNHDCGRCKHTTMIEHAVNFQAGRNKHSVNFYEKENNTEKESGRIDMAETTRLTLTELP